MGERLHRSGLFVLLFALVGLTACGGGQDSSSDDAVPGEGVMAFIEGNVFYRERMMLPPGAEVEVQLQDISRADAPATVLASVLLTPDAGPPYDFAIEYDPAGIDSRMRYALRATISAGDQMMFSSTDYIDPFGDSPVEILVRRVAEPVQSSDGPALQDQPWALQTLGGKPTAGGAGGQPLDIELLAEDMRVGGFSGCNRYSGSYSLTGDAEQGSALTFGSMAGTMMACAEGGELERAYLQMLEQVSAYRLQGDTLSLLAGAEVVATFRPR
jgi:putative lipoprotein